jgi:hypothetical protein
MAAPSVSQRCATFHGPGIAHAHLSKGRFRVDPPLVARFQIHTLGRLQSVSPLGMVRTLCRRTRTAGVRAPQEAEQSAAFVQHARAPGTGGVPRRKSACQSREGRQICGRAAGTGAPEAQGGSAGKLVGFDRFDMIVDQAQLYCSDSSALIVPVSRADEPGVLRRYPTFLSSVLIVSSFPQELRRH